MLVFTFFVSDSSLPNTLNHVIQLPYLSLIFFLDGELSHRGYEFANRRSRGQIDEILDKGFQRYK